MVLVVVAGAWGSAICAGSIHIYSSDFNLSIPSPDEPESEYGRGWMNDAIMEIPDHFAIHDLDVGISLTHENFIDLQIILQSPWGTAIVLNPALNIALLNIGGHMEIVFDDEALLAIEQAQPPFTGRFRPIEPYRLSAFDGEDSFGPWRLRIYDAFYADIGTLNSFELVIATPEPATAVLLTLGFSLMTRLNHPGKQ